MKIIIASDHAGYKAKKALVHYLRSLGHIVLDIGAHSEKRVDYPDFAQSVAETVSFKKCDRGILVCGTGIGMSIAANKIPGVRAAAVWSSKTAELASKHNRANVLCLSGRLFSVSALKKMINAWLKTPFEKGRHLKRIKKITELEKVFLNGFFK